MLFSALPDAPGLVRPRQRVGLLWRRHDHRHPGPPLARHRRRRARSLWNTSNTAAPRVPSPTAVTAQASSSSCPSNCSARSSTSNFPRPRRTAPTPLPQASASCRRIPSPAPPLAKHVEAIAVEEGLHVLGWRAVPVDPDGAEVGVTALGCMPYMSQLFVAAPQRHRRHRPRPARLPAEKARRAQRRLLPVAVQPHHGLQGHAHDNAAAPILSGPAGRNDA